LIGKSLATHDRYKLLEVGMGKRDLALKILRHFDKTQISYVGMDVSEQHVLSYSQVTKKNIQSKSIFDSAQPLNDPIDSVELEVLLKENGFKIVNQVGLVLVFYTTNLIEGFLKFPLTPLRKIFEHLEKTSPFAPHTLYQLVFSKEK